VILTVLATEAYDPHQIWTPSPTPEKP
jgi:hypothetical protein